MIDCDVHPQIGDPEDLLAHIEEAQRDWFRAQPYFGLPGYSWTHPTSWYRQDLDGGPVELQIAHPVSALCLFQLGQALVQPADEAPDVRDHVAERLEAELVGAAGLCGGGRRTQRRRC